MKDRRDLAPVGYVVKTHGIHGELNCELDIEYEDFEPLEFVFFELDGLMVPFHIEGRRRRGSFGVLLELEGVDSDSAAAPFAGLKVYAEVELDEGDRGDEGDGFYLDDMEGWSVWSGGRELGVLEGFDDSTDNVLLNVRRPDGTLLLIPAAEEFFTDFKASERRIDMTLPRGLLDLN